MSGNQQNPEAQAPTKTVAPRQAHPLHSRIIDPENHGVSRVYHFHPDNDHTLEVDESDAAILMNGPDKAEFRIRAS